MTHAPIRVTVVQTVVVPATDGTDALRMMLRGSGVTVETVRGRAGRDKKQIDVATLKSAVGTLYELAHS